MIETTIRAGIVVTDTNIGHTVIETSALQDGIAARKPAGGIADYLLAKPRNTDAARNGAAWRAVVLLVIREPQHLSYRHFGSLI